MSSRNFRKLCPHKLPPLDSDDSDADYQPMYSRQKNKKSTYAGLEVSTDSEHDREHETEVAEVPDSIPHGGARKKTVIKKKKKEKTKKPHKTNKQYTPSFASTSNDNSVGQVNQELDEIDRSLLEVNALLGTPPPAPPEPSPPTQFERMREVMMVQAKHLNVSNELRKLFGPEDPEDVKIRARTQPYRARVLKRVLVTPTNDMKIYNFWKGGLSMSILKKVGDVVYFVYDHDEDYQKRHKKFLNKYTQSIRRHGSGLVYLDDAKKNMHLEPLIEAADFLFRAEEYSIANELLENIVTYLQFVAHPSFILTSMNVRLTFDYLENRPFHVAMMRYMYMLSNKACHRTALEIAKMLLNIDPTDPLAVLFVIDTLALRAREHQWLIDAIDYLNKTRQANMLFNIQYSYALAHYHVAMKNKSDLVLADRYLKGAMMACPRVVVNIFESANIIDADISGHKMFSTESTTIGGQGLNELMMIYARLTWSRWREPGVLDWFMKNAKEIADEYNQDQAVRDRVEQLATLRLSLFQVYPPEVLRHMAVIRTMANLLLDTPMRPSDRPTCAWDPLMDGGINRFMYPASNEPPRNVAPGGQAMLYRFFTSIFPSTDLEPPIDD
ncbi:nuclear localized protein 1 [Anticarsia gemmatalis]|uniref:nuclear localized protein 1 n=1 Tax=Anticarsia gemmatalis TaxID=129554 RepID=UPI003F769474